MKDLNYYQTFITVAPDCSVTEGMVPPSRKSGRTKPQIEYELLSKQPYTYTQEDILFEVHIRHKSIPKEELSREDFFKKSHACLRASMLPKKYGWGLHFDENGRIALYGVETIEYQTFKENDDSKLKLLAAMRTSRKQA